MSCDPSARGKYSGVRKIRGKENTWRDEKQYWHVNKNAREKKHFTKPDYILGSK
jgi:hypothetical protein